MEPMTAAGEAQRRGIFRASVLENRRICPDHYLLRLELAALPPTRPGQFVNVRCGRLPPDAAVVDWPEGAWPRLTQPELADRQPLLRRPFSLAGRRDLPGGVHLEILHRVVGVGTAWLAELGAGAEVDLLGPLGNGFSVGDDRPVAVLVGGGVGIPPLLYLAETLAPAGKQTVAFVGARTARLLPLTVAESEPPSQAGRPTMCTAEFAARGAATVVATDDGSLGVAGMAHEALARWLERQRLKPGELAVYACGPEPMLRAVADLCGARAVRCELALERHMACGMGTCQSCVVKVRDAAPPGWRYKLACRDGPVFDAEELIWE